MKRFVHGVILFVAVGLLVGLAVPKGAFAVTPVSVADEAPVEATSEPAPTFPLIDGPRQQDQFQGVVVRVVESRSEMIFGSKNIYQLLEIRPTTKKPADKTILAENGGVMAQQTQIYEVGDKVILSELVNNGESSYFVLDYVRTGALIELLILFMVVSVLVARKKGLFSLIGLAYSFLVIFAFAVPQLIAGQNPVVIALITGALVVPVNFYLSHGFNRKTHIAIVSTILSLAITAVLSHVFIGRARLTGFGTEDAAFLAVIGEHTINMKGLLLAGIIVGLFGILDDITISQAAIVEKLKEASPHLKFKELYSKAMDVGKDHIGSLVNTLVLVYAGGALPFVLLLVFNDQSFSMALNYEMIAEQVVRTLSASIGLILAVPITTFLAALWSKE